MLFSKFYKGKITLLSYFNFQKILVANLSWSSTRIGFVSCDVELELLEEEGLSSMILITPLSMSPCIPFWKSGQSLVVWSLIWWYEEKGVFEEAALLAER